jgi:hypothetical protein
VQAYVSTPVHPGAIRYLSIPLTKESVHPVMVLVYVIGHTETEAEVYPVAGNNTTTWVPIAELYEKKS